MALLLSLLANLFLLGLLFRNYRWPIRRLRDLLAGLRQGDRLPLPAPPASGGNRTLAEIERTLRDQAERFTTLTDELHHRQQQSATIFDALHSGLILIDHTSRIVFSNRQFNHWFSPHRPCLGLTPSEACLTPRLHILAREVQRTRQPAHIECALAPHREASPEGHTFRIAALPARLAPGPPETAEVREVLFLFEDITRLHQLETIRRDFVANASHELRTPLSIIAGYLENLLDGALDDRPTALRFLHTMQKHTDRLNSLVADLLTLSRLESSAHLLQPEPMDLAACFDDVLERLQPLVRRHTATVTTHWPHRPFTIHADRFCLDQVLFNLLDNSLKHSDKPAPHISLHATLDPDHTPRLTLTDNGPGIPLKDQPYIFNRFYRVARDRSRHPGTGTGTGLGLSIVRHAIESHNGRITLDSQPGQGVTITITLPPAPAAVPSVHPAQPVPHATPLAA